MSKIMNRAYSEFYSKNGYLPKYFNPYNVKDLSVPYEGGGCSYYNKLCWHHNFKFNGSDNGGG